MRNQLPIIRVKRVSAVRNASRGQTMVEYVLLLAAIALTAFGGMSTAGQKVNSSIKTSTAQVGSKVTAGGGVSVSLPDAS
jgi:Flp pilus assembly pilin Flp